MSDAEQSNAASKAERQQARELVAAYHQEQLGRLLDHLRDGFVKLDAGEIDEFELDDLIHRYKKAAAKLWGFCTVGGSALLITADGIRRQREQGANTDWWELAASRRERGD